MGILPVALVLFSSMVFGQVLGSISGFVRDPSASAIAGATVALTNSETGVVHTVTADERGYYRALALPVGRYDVKSWISTCNLASLKKTSRSPGRPRW